MNAKPIPCQYGGGNEYHCDRSPCMICPGPVNQRQGVELAGGTWTLPNGKTFTATALKHERAGMTPEEYRALHLCEPLPDRCGYCTLDNYPKRCVECPNRPRP